MGLEKHALTGMTDFYHGTPFSIKVHCLIIIDKLLKLFISCHCFIYKAITIQTINFKPFNGISEKIATSSLTLLLANQLAKKSSRSEILSLTDISMDYSWEHIAILAEIIWCGMDIILAAITMGAKASKWQGSNSKSNYV
jgi:hypothetical protein